MTPHLPLHRSLLHPGDRIAVAVSGGADSVALFRSLMEQRGDLGISLSILHVHHGIRGAAADADARFVAELAAQHDVPYRLFRVDAPGYSAASRKSLEEAARDLRYGYFRRVLEEREADAVATAHTMDDQSETVFMRFLRGAWTRGLSGIFPVLDAPPGRIIRPMLGVYRAEVELYLRDLGQTWREDESNQDLAFTRNHLRHHVLPLLRQLNPAVDVQLSQMAILAREDEERWQSELERIMPQILLPGRAARGGGRSVPTGAQQESVALDVTRLRALAPSLRRRVLRAAVGKLRAPRFGDPASTPGPQLSFHETQSLLDICFGENAGTNRKLTLGSNVRAERTARELHISLARVDRQDPEHLTYSLPIPGEVAVPPFLLHFRAEPPVGAESEFEAGDLATVRPWAAGDRVLLAHSSGPKKVKEVLSRMQIGGDDRANWPVVVWRGEVIWIQGANVAARPEIPTVTVTPLASAESPEDSIPGVAS